MTPMDTPRVKDLLKDHKIRLLLSGKSIHSLMLGWNLTYKEAQYVKHQLIKDGKDEE
jgi:hypothetical protein